MDDINLNSDQLSLEKEFIVGESNSQQTRPYELSNPLDVLAPQQDPYRSWGWGDLDDLPWPVEDDLLVSLGGDSVNALMLWKQLMDDQAVSSTFTKVVQNIISREVIIDSYKAPDEDKPSQENEQIADFVRNQINSSKFDDLTASLLEAYIIGISHVQPLWEVNYSSVVWKGYKYVYPRRVIFSKKDGKARILTKNQPVKGEPITKYKRRLITFRYCHLPSDSPYGRGLGVELYHPVLFLRRAYESWAVAGDRYATPLPIAKVGADATPGERKLLLQKLMNLQREKAIVIPQSWTIEMQSGRADAQFYSQQVNLYQMVINKLIAGETTTGEDTTAPGSYARDRISMDLLTQRAKMLSDRLSETLNDTLIRWIVDLNFGEDIPAPRVYRSFPEQTAIIDVQNLTSLIAAGYQMDPAWIEETYNVKLAPPEEEAGDDMGMGMATGEPTQESFDDFFAEEEPTEEDQTLAGLLSNSPTMEGYFTEVEGESQPTEEDAALSGLLTGEGNNNNNNGEINPPPANVSLNETMGDMIMTEITNPAVSLNETAGDLELGNEQEVNTPPADVSLNETAGDLELGNEQEVNTPPADVSLNEIAGNEQKEVTSPPTISLSQLFN